MRNLRNFFLLVCIGLANGQSGSSCTGHGFIVDSSDCNKYFQCTNGVYVQNNCPSGLNFNVLGSYCDWPANVDCKNSAQPEPEQPNEPEEPQESEEQSQPEIPSDPQPEPEPEVPPTNGDALVSHAEFQAAASTKWGNPDPSYYAGFIKSLNKAGISNRREAVLFLAHAVWETVGFIYTKEVYCQTNLAGCLAAYPNNAGGLAGRVYYGRGMMQLTWDYNYKAASAYLYGDDRLLQNPDVVGEDPEVGWATAAWYWFANVHDRSQTFGSTLKAINGALECEGGSHGENRYLRFKHYKDILALLGEPQPSDDDGWCTAW